MKNADMPAMPVFDSSGCPSLYGDDGVEAKGPTKREMMAMHAMVGLLSCGKQYDIRHKSRASQLVEDAVFYADALLDELERTE